MFIMKTEGFKYYAFISYSHKDQKLAKRLQRHLETYHLPSSLLKTNPELPKRISPVFMDESNLVAPGTLKSALRDNLDNSNYLIVICSPNSAKSEYVNDEVEYFIETGRVDHIIPFIIEGTPHSIDESKECFPRAILNLPRDHELLGIDMQKFGVRDSFSRVIATLLSLDLDHFVDYEKRRRRRKIAAIASVAAAFMIAAGIFVWKNIIPHYSYYHTYVYKWEKPIGLFEVRDEAERKKKEYTYKFTSVGGKVRTIERINSAGILVDPAIITPFTELPMIKFVSDRTVEYYDVNGKKVYRKEYTKNFEAVDFYRGDGVVPYDMHSNTPDSYSANTYSSALGSIQNSGNIIRMTLEYDDNGYLVRKIFRVNTHGGLDKKGTHFQDEKGRSGFSYTHDDKGRVIEVHYLDTERDNVSIGGVHTEHIEYGNAYDPVSITYEDKDGNLTLNSQGIAHIAIGYDEYFNIGKLSYYGADGKRVMNTEYGISEAVFTHDADNGFLTSESFYDAELVPCTCNEHYFRAEFSRDDEGRIAERIFYDVKGERIIYVDGIAAYSAEEAYDLGGKYYRDKDYKHAVEWLEKAAEQGSILAQYDLGCMYQQGDGVELDYEQAVKWWRKAAEQGYSLAQNNLGVAYKDGYGVKQDYEQAFEWFEKAAEQYLPTAQYNLGYIYMQGLGVKQDYRQAAEWYLKAAEQDLPLAQYNLGVLYEHGLGVNRDYRQSAEWYLKAAMQGNALAQNNLGVLYEKGYGVYQDYRQAAMLYQKAAVQGYHLAQNNLGALYEKGLGVEQDYRQAAELYRKSAEQGLAMAQSNLGVLYDKGLGVEQNYREAAEWYQKAAVQGNAAAQNNLGYLYQTGNGVKQDYKQAIEWYLRAAKQNDANAQTNLGYMYTLGYGVKQDFNQAAKWYRKAAEQGLYTAQNNLALLYEYGLGVEKNIQTAYMWHCIAYLSGHEPAEESMKNLEGQLTESQINEAKSQAQKKFNEIKEKNQ